MKSQLKKTKVYIESLDKEVTVKELSYADLRDITKANAEENELGLLVMVQRGIMEFGAEDLDDIGAALPMSTVMDIGNVVAEFSGLNEDAEKK